MPSSANIRPPLKHTPFDSPGPDGAMVVSREWYDWAMNIRKAVDTLRVIVGDPDGDGVVTSVNNLLTADVPVYAPQMLPTVTNGCQPLEAIELDPAQPNLVVLPFLANVDTSADFHAMLPFSWAGKAFKVWLYWGHGDSGTSWDVAWEVTTNSTYDNELITRNFLPGILVTDSGGTAGNLYIAQSAVVPIASYENEDGSIVSVRVTRRGTYAEDTMDITAYLLAVRFILDGTPLVGPAPVTGYDSSLLLHLDNSFADSSVNNHTPAVSGSLGFTASAAFGTHAGVGNGAGFVSYAHSTKFDLKQQWAFDCWVYVPTGTSWGSTNTLAAKWSISPNRLRYIIGFNGSGQFVYLVGTGTGFSTTWTCTLSVPTNQWVHLAVYERHSGSNYYLEMAVGGVVENKVTALIVDQGPGESDVAPLCIGNLEYGTAALPTGVRFDEMRLFNETCPYDGSNFTPPTAPYA